MSLKTNAESPDLKTAHDVGAFELGGTLLMAKAGTGSGRVTGFGLDCGSDCQADGDVLTLTPIPDPGSIFIGFTGDLDCTDGQVKMKTNKTCIAILNLDLSPVCKRSLSLCALLQCDAQLRDVASKRTDCFLTH